MRTCACVHDRTSGYVYKQHTKAPYSVVQRARPVPLARNRKQPVREEPCLRQRGRVRTQSMQKCTGMHRARTYVSVRAWAIVQRTTSPSVQSASPPVQRTISPSVQRTTSPFVHKSLCLASTRTVYRLPAPTRASQQRTHARCTVQGPHHLLPVRRASSANVRVSLQPLHRRQSPPPVPAFRPYYVPRSPK